VDEVRHALTARVSLRPAGGLAGFTLFELIVVICIVSILAGILLNRLEVYKEAAEKAAMQQTAAAIKSALQMRVASYMITGRDKEIENLRNEIQLAGCRRNRLIMPESFTLMPMRAFGRAVGISTSVAGNSFMSSTWVPISSLELMPGSGCATG